MAASVQVEWLNLIKYPRVGMQAAKRRGKHIGWPYKLTTKQIITALAEILAGKSTITAMAKKLGCSRSTLSKAFEKLNIKV